MTILGHECIVIVYVGWILRWLITSPLVICAETLYFTQMMSCDVINLYWIYPLHKFHCSFKSLVGILYKTSNCHKQCIQWDEKQITKQHLNLQLATLDPNIKRVISNIYLRYHHYVYDVIIHTMSVSDNFLDIAFCAVYIF